MYTKTKTVPPDKVTQLKNAINHIRSTLVQEKYADYAYAHLTEASYATDEQLELDELIGGH